MVEFDAAKHVYTVNGLCVVSVTQAIQRAGLIDTSGFCEHARSRGQAVHAAIDLYHARDLDEGSLDSEVKPYFDSYLEFLRDTRFRVYAHDCRVASRVFGYAGTIDLYGRLRRHRAVIDIKTGAAQDWHALQLAAYIQAARECGKKPTSGFSLYLTPNEGRQYALRPIDFHLSLDRFLAALEAAKKEEQNG